MQVTVENESTVMIESVDNGYILTTFRQDEEDGSYKGYKSVFQVDSGSISNENLGECEALRDLLWNVREALGAFYSKHNKYNVEIRIVNAEGQDIEEIKEGQHK